MVVTVGAVGVVEMAVDEVVHMVAMRHGLVAAARAVDVIGRVAAAGVGRRAGVGVGGADSQPVLVHVVPVDVVEMAVVEVVHMAFVPHGGVAAAGAVLVGVVGMRDAVVHGSGSSGFRTGNAPANGESDTFWPSAVNPGEAMRMQSSFLLTAPGSPALCKRFASKKPMNRRAHLLLVVLLACAAPWRAAAAAPAPLRVVSSTTDLDSLARIVGGPRVTAFSLATGTQDPHELELKPNFIRELDRADLFLQVGLGLENAWLERMMNAVKNPAVKPGQPGNLNLGRGVRPLEGEETEGIPGSFHEEGNPHYLLDPVEGLRAAAEIRDRLAGLRPEWKDEFAQRYEAFRLALGTWLVGAECAKDDDVADLAVKFEQAKGDAFDTLLKEHKLGGHLAALAPHRGRQIVGDHDLWPYFARRFGLEILGYLEPSPGVPPTTKHLQELIGRMKRQDVQIILSNPYFDPQHARFVGRATGAQIVPMAHQPGARRGTDSYLEMVKYNGARLLEALAASSKGQAPSSR